MPAVNIMALVSGGGTNLQALLEAEKKGELGEGKLVLVVSDRPGAYALERAKKWGIPVFVEEPDMRLAREERQLELSERLFRLARESNIGVIVMIGFLSILAGKILRHYSDRIINLHPSLLPKYGGDGMYGERVHRAVLDAGDRESGCTVHFVDEGTDTGKILLQRSVPVLTGDTPDSLADRIHSEEHIAIVEAVKIVCGSFYEQLKQYNIRSLEKKKETV